MAVGTDSTTTQVAAEWWNGHHWNRLPIPNPGGLSDAYLSAVSCPSAAECVAVGWGQDKSGGDSVPVAEAWTRSGGWTPSTPVVPTGTGSALAGISCPSASLCYAAGGANQAHPVFTDQLPLVERWTPRSGWARVNLPTLRGSTSSGLNAISCKSDAQCAAVGSYFASRAVRYGLIEQLNGSAWSVAAAPESASGNLTGVSCPSTSLCVAVGSARNSSLAERWSAGRWTAATPPGLAEPGGEPGLSQVSCASATHCVAGGGTLSHAFSGGFVDTLNGTTWTMTAQDGPGFEIGLLFAVRCFSTSPKAVSCAVIGSTPPIDGSSLSLSAFLSASKWSIVSTV
jgi:hypothetical protein